MRLSRSLTVWSAIALTVALTGCSVPMFGDPQQTAQRDSDSTVVAFYGDSYTRGTGASDASLRWSTIISEERDWIEFNPSADGLGFISNRSIFGNGDLPSLIIAEDPGIVFITMGLNDNFSFATAADDIRAQIDDDLDRLTTALPGARFVVVEPFWYTEERPPSVDTIIGWVRDAAARVDADYIAGASYWLDGHPEWIASDGLHPNDDGHAQFAVLMDAELQRLGL